MVASERLVVRVSGDSMHLEALCPLRSSADDRDQLLEWLRADCAALQAKYAPTRRDVDAVLDHYSPGTWVELSHGIQPVPPVNGRVEVVVPIPVPGSQPRQRLRKCVVRVGTTLARRFPGVPGEAGRDVRGTVVSPRAPAEARLPQGTNTEVSEDGIELIAVCDGEVMLRNLAISIEPVLLHIGDVPAGTVLVSETVPIYVDGSVLEGSLVEANGDVYIKGDVVDSHIQSSSNVMVTGAIGGTKQRASVVRAAGDIIFEQARLTHLHAGRDIHVLAHAWQCSLQGRGNVYLSDTLSEALKDVIVEITGGLFPANAEAVALPDQMLDRQDARVGCQFAAELAVHGNLPLKFLACTVVDLSEGGARCVLTGPRAAAQLEEGAIAQLKLVFPGMRGQLIAIASIARVTPGGSIGLAFLQMTARDHGRLTAYCQQQILKPSTSMLTSRDQRDR